MTVVQLALATAAADPGWEAPAEAVGLDEEGRALGMVVAVREASLAQGVMAVVEVKATKGHLVSA